MAENENEARQIADARVCDGDTAWSESTRIDDGYIEIYEVETLEQP